LEEKAAKLVKAEQVLQKLYDAINAAGFAVMQTSGAWSIHDISKLAEVDHQKTLLVIEENIDLRAQVQLLKAELGKCGFEHKVE
jgi:hypothetical protein